MPETGKKSCNNFIIGWKPWIGGGLDREWRFGTIRNGVAMTQLEAFVPKLRLGNLPLVPKLLAPRSQTPVWERGAAGATADRSVRTNHAACAAGNTGNFSPIRPDLTVPIAPEML